jgi:hypothetical protein
MEIRNFTAARAEKVRDVAALWPSIVRFSAIKSLICRLGEEAECSRAV